MADIAMDHDVDALHRYAAARGGVALDDEQAAAARSAGILAGITFDHHAACHHVLGDPGTGRAVHGDGAADVHAGAVVAHRASHRDGDRLVDTDRERVRSARIDDLKGDVVV